jgi:hypothetical protein
MRRSHSIAALLCVLCLCAGAPPGKYVNNFEQTKPGPVPEELMVLNGGFTIAQMEGNHVLELAGQPLESDGLLFGPAEATTCEVAARIWAASVGRRFPEIGIGSNDVAGYKLWLSPGQALLELRKGEQPGASAPYREWKSGTWTQLRLRVSKTADGKWTIEGKAWPDGKPEPKQWMLMMQDIEAPVAGRASIWGTPYSGQPIRFDDLNVTPTP